MMLKRILLSDTSLLRLLLAFIASMWAALLWTDGTLDYSFIGSHLTPREAQQMWATHWTVLALLKYWRIFDSRRRPIADALVHSYSVLVFSSSIAAIYLSPAMTAHNTPADLADDIGCVVASVFLLIRTAHLSFERR